MNDSFDELTKGLAQSVTRRGALKQFGLGVAGMALAALGLANTAQAQKPCFKCQCHKADYGCTGVPDSCYSQCISTCPAYCQPY